MLLLIGKKQPERANADKCPSREGSVYSSECSNRRRAVESPRGLHIFSNGYDGVDVDVYEAGKLRSTPDAQVPVLRVTPHGAPAGDRIV